MSYKYKEELTSIISSIFEIGSNYDTPLKPYTDMYCNLWRKFNNTTRPKYWSFMGNREKTHEVKEEVSAAFTDLEQLLTSNGKKLKDICLEHKDDEEFHPSKKEYETLRKLFNEAHDGICTFEALLTVF